MQDSRRRTKATGTSAPERPPSEAWKGYALAVLAATSWATGGVMAKWLFSPLDAGTADWVFPPLGIEVEPMTLSAARAVVSALILFGYLSMRRREELRIDRRSFLFLVMFGVVGLAMVHYSYFEAISYTNVATAILLEYLAPVLVLVVSVLFLGERLTLSLPIGVLLAIAGCALVVGVASGDGVSVSRMGLAWGLASAVFFAGYSLLGRYAATRFSPWTMMSYGLGSAAAFWMVIQGGPAQVLGLLSKPGGLGAVLFIAVFSTIIPFSAFLKALHYIDPTRATVTATLEPVLAGIVAYVLFGESFDLTQLTGGVMVVAAIIIVQFSGATETRMKAMIPPPA